MQTQQFLGQYEISTDAARFNIQVIPQLPRGGELFGRRNPANRRGESDPEFSLFLGVYLSTSKLGLLESSTDKATFALLADVFILSAHRGKGLSKWLMRSIVGHEDLQG